MYLRTDGDVVENDTNTRQEVDLLVRALGLEGNPNPGWCWDGKFNIMADFAGNRYADLLHMVIDAAQRRVAQSARESDVVTERAVA